METLTFDKIRLEFDGPLATLVMADPDRLNALTLDMVEGIQSALIEIAKPRRGARCLMITGEGRAFCAGANLMRRKEEAASDAPSSAGGALETMFHPMIRKFRDVEIPVVAAVNGPCVGIGVAIALLADYLIASDKAYFLVPFRNLASCTDSGLTWLLPRSIGPARAAQLVMRAERLPSEVALSWGMVNQVVASETFSNVAREVAQEFAEGPTVALGLMRRLLQESAQDGFDAQLEAEARGVRKTSRTQDNATAIKAFGSKTPVKFVGS